MTARILVADDEQTFLQSLADLLRARGYECATASTAETAVAAITDEDFDVLIADVRMPGNDRLQLIESLPEIAPGLPAILVTAYPEIDTATRIAGSVVTAYVVKPFDVAELDAKIEMAMESRKVFKAVAQLRERVRQWDRDLDNLLHAAQMPGPSSGATAETLVALTAANVLQALAGATGVAGGEPPERDLCYALPCQRAAVLEAAVEDAVSTLVRTKQSFKSKELGRLRVRLERALKTGGARLVEAEEGGPQG